MFTWFHTANVHPFSQWFEDNHRNNPHGPEISEAKSQQLNFPAVRSSCRTNAAPGGISDTKVDLPTGGREDFLPYSDFADFSNICLILTSRVVAFTEGCGWSGSSHAEYWEPQHLGCQHQATKQLGDTGGILCTGHLTPGYFVRIYSKQNHSKRPEIPQL